MESTDIKDIPIFFIMGRPRSGTTLLRTLFDAHPNVKIPPEFPILLPLYQKFRHVKDWDEKMILSFIDHIYQNKAFKNRTLENLKIEREPYTEKLMTLAHRGTLQDFLKSFNMQAFSLFPKSEILRVGDKNPIYSIFVNRFMKVFPEAKFICITRDYRDNYISMKGLTELQLEAPILTLQVTRWRYVAKRFLKFREKYPDRFHIVRYEDLVQNQEEVFRKLCEFLGIPYDPGVFDFFRKKEETFKIYPKELVEKFHKSLMNPINTGRMNLWQKELTEKQVKLADQIAGKYADRLGYERKYKGFSLWCWLKSRPLAIYSYIIFKIMVLGTYLPYRMSWWLSVNLLVLVKIYSKFTGKKLMELPQEK
jgi:hypothetical protein